MIRLKSISNGDYPERMTYWSHEIKGNAAVVSLTTGRKLREDNIFDKKIIDSGLASGKYVNSRWNFWTFIGEARKKLDSLKPQDNICDLSISMSNEPFLAEDGSKKFAQSPRIVVTDFNIYNPNNTNKGAVKINQAPIVMDADDDLPF